MIAGVSSLISVNMTTTVAVEDDDKESVAVTMILYTD